jgi:hypothetical protein
VQRAPTGVSSGRFESFAAAAGKGVTFFHTYQPRKTQHLEKKYRQCGALYEASLSVGGIQ